jgi:hypothetical protein
VNARSLPCLVRNEHVIGGAMVAARGAKAGAAALPLATSGEARRPWPKTRNASGGLIAGSAGHTATALSPTEQCSPNRRDNAACSPNEHSTSGDRKKPPGLP